MTGARRRPASRPSRRRCFLASSRVDPFSDVTSSLVSGLGSGCGSPCPGSSGEGSPVRPHPCGAGDAADGGMPRFPPRWPPRSARPPCRPRPHPPSMAYGPRPRSPRSGILAATGSWDSPASSPVFLRRPRPPRRRRRRGASSSPAGSSARPVRSARPARTPRRRTPGRNNGRAARGAASSVGAAFLRRRLPRPPGGSLCDRLLSGCQFRCRRCRRGRRGLLPGGGVWPRRGPARVGLVRLCSVGLLAACGTLPSDLPAGRALVRARCSPRQEFCRPPSPGGVRRRSLRSASSSALGVGGLRRIDRAGGPWSGSLAVGLQRITHRAGLVVERPLRQPGRQR